MTNDEMRAVNERIRRNVACRPTLSADGTMWCVLLGDDLASGVAGFGETPAEAVAAFDRAFWTERTPAARLKARSDAATPPPSVWNAAAEAMREVIIVGIKSKLDDERRMLRTSKAANNEVMVTAHIDRLTAFMEVFSIVRILPVPPPGAAP